MRVNKNNTVVGPKTKKNQLKVAIKFVELWGTAELADDSLWVRHYERTNGRTDEVMCLSFPCTDHISLRPRSFQVQRGRVFEVAGVHSHLQIS